MKYKEPILTAYTDDLDSYNLQTIPTQRYN